MMHSGKKWLTVNCSYSHSSLAFPLIHQACGGEWEHVEVTIKDDCASVARRLRNAGIICASLYIFNRPVVLDILSRVKVLEPESVIIVGGPECKGEGALSVMEESPFVDFVCRGEGEAVMPDLLAALCSEQTDWMALAQVPGLVYRRNGHIFDNPGEPVYEDWGKGALVVEDCFYNTAKPFVQVETSRGCPNHCIFCTSGNSRVRYRELENVQAEFQRLHDRGIREVRLLDRTFNVPSNRAVALLQMFRLHFADMRFHLEVHPALLNDVLREVLKQAIPGQLHIEAGIQTLQEDVLEAIGRPNTLAAAFDGLAFLCSLPQVAVHTDLIAGCPRQTLKSLKEDLLRLMELSPAEIQLEVMKVLPGTPLAINAGKLGVCHAPKAPYDVMCTPDMSPEDIASAMKYSRMIDIFYNAEPLRSAFRELALAEQGFLERFMFVLDERGMHSGPAPQLRLRFLLLDEFCVDAPKARMILAQSWLSEAYPPGEGPAAEARFVSALPQGLTCLRGREETVTMRDSRFVFLPPATYFVYNRALAPNKAVAVFHLNP